MPTLTQPELLDRRRATKTGPQPPYLTSEILRTIVAAAEAGKVLVKNPNRKRQLLNAKAWAVAMLRKRGKLEADL